MVNTAQSGWHSKNLAKKNARDCAAVPLNQQRAGRQPDCETLREYDCYAHKMVTAYHNRSTMRPVDIGHIY